jgi:protein-S-isoprenylcysteine O-methyltransferase Ste14
LAVNRVFGTLRFVSPEQIIPACWVIFAAVWWIAAFSVKRAAERVPLRDQAPSRILVMAGYLTLIRPDLFPTLDLRLLPHNETTGWLGAGGCILGLLGALWARATLAGNWSSNVTFKQSHELIVRGPYRFVRHPIYTSLLLMIMATAVYKGRLGSLVAFLLAFAGFSLKLRQEEALMIRHFPNDYPAYKSRVKALVPFVL